MIHLKGCPLKCAWCSTPESQSVDSQLGFQSEKCIGCGGCLNVCERHAIHLNEEDKASIDRNLCNNCFLCADACYSNALRRLGNLMTIEQLYNEIIKDRVFYETSGGGVVFSGGEPMMSLNNEFLFLLDQLKKEDISIGIDTSGYAAREKYEKIMPYVNYYLWDIKQMDPKKHRKITGVDNQLILSNLKYVDKMKKDIYIRYPVIPGYTDDDANLVKICEVAKEMKHLKEIHLIPFHHMGTDRYNRIGCKDPTEEIDLIEIDNMEKRKAYVEKLRLPVKIIE